MRRRVILSPATRVAVFDPPDSHDEAQRRHVLAPEDVALAKRRRRSHNRLGFAVQLALVRDLGRPPQIGEVLPAAVIGAVAEQIGVDPVVFALYAKREETRREHAREIIATLGLRPVQATDYRGLIAAATRTATGTEQGEPIVRAAIEMLKTNGILIPGADRIERLALAGRAAARRQAHRDLIRGLDAATCAGRAHGNLNKGETRHSLVRAVFRRQLGELRDRIAETMACRACGLNLVVNAIILWNTVYLSRAVRFVREQGVDLPDRLLAQVAPIPWGHIGLTGDYLWNEIDQPPERFRPLRTNRFNPKAFVFP